MRIPSLISFVGFVMIIAGSYCPLIHFPLINWDAFDLNRPYGIVILLVAVIGLLSTVFSLAKVTRLTAWLSLILIAFLLGAAIFQAQNKFNFIPFHFLSRFLTKGIKYRWGWYILFAGALLALAGTLGKKQINNITTNS